MIVKGDTNDSEVLARSGKRGQAGQRLQVAVPVARVDFVLDAHWVVVALLAIWAVATVWVSVAMPMLNRVEAWMIAPLMVLLVWLSVVGHALAHVVCARVLGAVVPSRMPLYLFGDAAHVWEPAPSSWREALVALAGPLCNVLLAGLCYLAWSAQLHPYLNGSALFLMYVNAGMALLNLAPGWPFDGGRLTRAILWGLLHRAGWGDRIAVWLGRFLVAGLLAWAAYVAAQNLRFSLEIGAALLFGVGLLVLALWRRSAPRWGAAYVYQPLAGWALLRGATAATLVAALLSVALLLVPLPRGVYAPGNALRVEPMIGVPEHLYHRQSGSFLLTTVVTHTPIIAGQWLQSMYNPAIQMVPPERVVPPDVTPQELAELNLQMLRESESVATVMGLQLAGYDASINSEAAMVVSVAPESLALELLEPGDWVVAINNEPVATANDLISRVRAHDPQELVNLLVKRNEQLITVQAPLLPPDTPGDPPRLGITVRSVGFVVDLPFDVEIETRKIAGGPSAGLMFTLTIYNMLTPEDVTRGWPIAGTGTINDQGEIGPIGGVAQKVAAAERSGAAYFLVPDANFADAQRAARNLRVVPVSDVYEALSFLRSLPMGPGV